MTTSKKHISMMTIVALFVASLASAPAAIAQTEAKRANTGAVESFTSAELATARAAVQYDDSGNPIELSTDELATLPQRIREILTAESSHVRSIRSDPSDARSPNTTRSDSWNWQGWHHGCVDIAYSRKSYNILGWVLMKATTKLLEVCSDGNGRIANQPVVQRSQSASWGWTECGWDGTYITPRSNRRRYEAGGTARFSTHVPAVANLCDTIDVTVESKIKATAWDSGDWIGWWSWG